MTRTKKYSGQQTFFSIGKPLILHLKVFLNFQYFSTSVYIGKPWSFYIFIRLSLWKNAMKYNKTDLTNSEFTMFLVSCY